MKINYYRLHNSQGYDESWQSCQFTAETDLSAFSAKPLVTINGQPFLRQHHVTYLTGRETCRAHHFAKHLAIQVLQSSESSLSSASSNSSQSSQGCKVLWIDTLHGPHICTNIYSELVAHAAVKSHLHFLCIDILGGQRDDVYWLNRNIEFLIKRIKPELVVIDDIDHFMPHCGINIATEFCRTVRDAINHSETAFLFIGYNHIGKKASTTGNLGKYLFMDASDVFSLSTQREVTTVRHISGYDLRRKADDSEFNFTIGPDNLPHEVAVSHGQKSGAIDDDDLHDIVTGILTKGQNMTQEELAQKISARQRELCRQDRATALINQALSLNLIVPVEETGSGSNQDVSEVRYTLHPSQSQGKTDNPLSLNEKDNTVNSSLTLPTHPQSIPSPASSPVDGDSAAVPLST